MLTHLSLFSGIGGIDLAATWAGFTTTAFCEKDKFCQGILAKHWPGVPIYGDIKEINEESLATNGIKPSTITLVSGGVPCQPYSCAGERKGNDDERALWPEMLRVIRYLKPTWVLIENVTGFVTMALDGVWADLEAADYTVQAFVIPASAVGAWHERQRCFVVAYSNLHGRNQSTGILQGRQTEFDNSSQIITHPNCNETSQRSECTEKWGWQNQAKQTGLGYCSTDTNETLSWAVGVGNNPNSPGREKLNASAFPVEQGQFTRGISKDGSHWSFEPGICPVVNGLPGRVAQLKALGNAVVPQQIYPILKAIADYERLYDSGRITEI